MELISKFEATGSCEFVEEFGRVYPATVFFEYTMGIPWSEGQEVLGWVDTMMATPDKAAAAMAEFGAWASDLIAKRRAAPRPDTLGALLEGQVSGRPLTDSELTITIMLLIVGGVETTKNALGWIMYHLATRPDLRSQLDADPDLLPAAIEEFLRHDAPVPGQGRATTCPATIANTAIPEGERILIYTGSANRDPEAYDDPDEIKLDRFTRPAKPHLTFGAGPHRCAGIHLARLELQIALEEILQRMKNFELTAPNPDLVAGMSYGHDRLPLKFTPAGPS